MPSAQAILSHLTVIANELTAVAIAWHVVTAGAIGALILGWRPSARRAGMLLAAPIASAAIAAVRCRAQSAIRLGLSRVLSLQPTPAPKLMSFVSRKLSSMVKRQNPRDHEADG